MAPSRSRSPISGSRDLRSAQNGHFWTPFGPKWDPIWGHPITIWSLLGPHLGPHILYPIEEGCQEGC